jgi:hypothetical protein
MVTNESWKEEVLRLRSEGASWESLIDKYQDTFSELSRYQIRMKLQNFVYRSAEGKKSQGEKSGEQITMPLVSGNPQELLMRALLKGTSIKDLSVALGVSERVALGMVNEKKKAGYNVHEAYGIWKITNDLIPSENRYQSDWDGNRIIRFGLMGDTQINSKYTQLTHLHRLYDIFAEEGITTVYHTGDIDDGEQMRKGHQYELYTQGVDDHADEIIRVYPRREGIRTKFITGNHDASMVRLAGVDIGRLIARDRDDMDYLGQDSAVIKLTDNCTFELRHPGDGTAYAISYKSQKMIEAMSGGEKPNLIGVGHYHKCEYLPYRNVHLFQTGCLQAQTPWMRSRGIAAIMGGWIVEVRLNVDGGVERVRQDWFQFYTAIRDDYKNWR